MNLNCPTSLQGIVPGLILGFMISAPFVASFCIRPDSPFSGILKWLMFSYPFTSSAIGLYYLCYEYHERQRAGQRVVPTIVELQNRITELEQRLQLQNEPNSNNNETVDLENQIEVVKPPRVWCKWI